MSKRRVVVTGMGIVSPLGNDLASTWDGIVNGRSGIGPITHFDPSPFTTRIAGLVKDFDVTRWVSSKDAKKWVCRPRLLNPPAVPLPPPDGPEAAPSRLR